MWSVAYDDSSQPAAAVGQALAYERILEEAHARGATDIIGFRFATRKWWVMCPRQCMPVLAGWF